MDCKNPSLKHPIVFCCDAYVHVPKESRSKRDSKVEKNIFNIGYKDDIKSCKLWNTTIKNIVYNHDVVFKQVNVVLKQEVQPREEEPQIIEFELEGEEFDSQKLDEL